MSQPSGGAGFALEAIDGFGLIEPAGMEQLQGDVTFDVWIVGTKDDAEAAGTQLAHDGVRTDALRQRLRQAVKVALTQSGGIAAKLFEQFESFEEIGMPR